MPSSNMGENGIKMTIQNIERLVIIDQPLFEDKTFVESLKKNFDFDVGLLLDVNELDVKSDNVIYISSTFEGPLFDLLLKHQKPVISDLVVQHCIEQRTTLPLPKHPLYNFFMKNFVICVSINDKKQARVINRYLNLIRFMNGQSRKDMKSGKSFDRTHLIEQNTFTVNYQLARIYLIPILNKEWVDHFWQHKRDVDFDPSDSRHVEPFWLKPFTNIKISLLNYGDDYDQVAAQVLEKGGLVVDNQESKCTHLVVKNHEECDYNAALESLGLTPDYVLDEDWLDGVEKYKKDEESHRLPTCITDNESIFKTPPHQNSIHQAINSLILSPNFDNSIDENLPVDKTDLKKQAITQELFQTERNYVNILNDIMKVFHEPLKNHQMPDQFPNEIEMKTIFGTLPPIIEVHQKILVELEKVVTHWRAENAIGKIFQQHSHDLLTVYPQYINFYEKTKETIELCQEKYEKFASFLKACQVMPECRKQTFQELLINPIQRLPRIEMYLRALLNKTDKLHPDFKSLNEALDTIVSVISQINNQKKKTESQIEMFDLLNDIEDCPATLLSAQRQFISKCDVKLLVCSGDHTLAVPIQKLDNYLFTLFLFTDMILVCKKRLVKRSSSLRERTTTLTSTVTKKLKKSYKFIETIALSSISRIYNDFEDDDMIPEASNAFVIMMDGYGCQLFPSFPFVVKDAESKKDKFVEEIKQAWLNVSQQDPDMFVLKGCIKNVDFSHSRAIARAVNKSKYVIMRTRERIGRTFSTRRSGVNSLKSSVSMEQIDSPSKLTSSPSMRLSRVFTKNLNFLTPSSLSRQQASSVVNINNIPHLDSSNVPTTPPTRKKKYHENPNLD